MGALPSLATVASDAATADSRRAPDAAMDQAQGAAEAGRTSLLEETLVRVMVGEVDAERLGEKAARSGVKCEPLEWRRRRNLCALLEMLTGGWRAGAADVGGNTESKGIACRGPEFGGGTREAPGTSVTTVRSLLESRGQELAGGAPETERRGCGALISPLRVVKYVVVPAMARLEEDGGGWGRVGLLLQVLVAALWEQAADEDEGAEANEGAEAGEEGAGLAECGIGWVGDGCAWRLLHGLLRICGTSGDSCPCVCVCVRAHACMCLYWFWVYTCTHTHVCMCVRICMICLSVSLSFSSSAPPPPPPPLSLQSLFHTHSHNTHTNTHTCIHTHIRVS